MMTIDAENIKKMKRNEMSLQLPKMNELWIINAAIQYGSIAQT